MKKITIYFGSLLLSASFCSAMDEHTPESMYNEFKYTYPLLTEAEFGNLFLDYDGHYGNIQADLERKHREIKKQQARGGSPTQTTSSPSTIDPNSPEGMYNHFKKFYPELSEEQFGHTYLYYEGNYEAIQKDLKMRQQSHQTSRPTTGQKRSTNPTIVRVPITPELMYALMAQQEQGSGIPGMMLGNPISSHNLLSSIIPETLPPLSFNTFISDKEFFKFDVKPSEKFHPVIQEHYSKYHLILKKQALSHNSKESLEAKKIASDKKLYDAGILKHIQDILRDLEEELFEVTGNVYLHMPSLALVDRGGNLEVIQTNEESYKAKGWIPSKVCHPTHIKALEAERREVFAHLKLIYRKQ